MVPPSRLRQPAAAAPPGWLPAASEVVEVEQDDVWWEALVLQAERAGHGGASAGRLLLRNRMTWESGWFDAESCRPSAAHREFMRAGITALDTRVRPSREQAAAPAPAAGGKRGGAKRARAEPEDPEREGLRAEAEGLLRDVLADRKAAADAGLVRAALEAALLVGVGGSAVEEAQGRLAAR